MKLLPKKIVTKNKPKGFTLVELSIYMGLLLVLIAVLTSLFGSILDAQLESDTTSIIKNSFCDADAAVTRYALLLLELTKTSRPVLPATVTCPLIVGFAAFVTSIIWSWFVLLFVATYAVEPITITLFPVPDNVRPAFNAE